MDFGVCNGEKLRVKMLPSNDSYPLDFEHAKPAIHGGLVLFLRKLTYKISKKLNHVFQKVIIPIREPDNFVESLIIHPPTKK